MNYLLYCFSDVDNFSPFDPLMELFNKSLRPEGMQRVQHTYNLPIHRWPSDYMWMTSLSAHTEM